MSKDNKSPYYTKSFSVSKENEKDIYDYLIEIEKTKKITEYIKELIRKDMSGGFATSNEIPEEYIKNLVNKLVEEKLNSLDINKTNNETATDLSNVLNKDENLVVNNDSDKSEDAEMAEEKLKKKKKLPRVAGVID